MSGALLSDPISYRDGRTAAVVDDVHRHIDPRQLYAITGIQFLPFNTIYQLAAERQAAIWPDVASVVLLPDLIAYWLTGELATEATNASTTGLVDATTGDWSPVVLDRLGLDVSILPPIQTAGATRGSVRPELCSRLGLRPTTVVTAVGSHDTASAVVAVPAERSDFAYISSGTWSLVGLELGSPVTSDDARAANFSNEAGVDGRTRFLRNVGGLWLLDESIRWWTESGIRADREELLRLAAGLPAGGPTIDVDAPEFIAPGDMPTRIRTAAGDRSDELATPATVVRCIVDSLAAAYDTAIRVACELSGRSVGVIHIVGGGSQNELLCELTAARTGCPVVAGPVEATALGNVIVQARACGALSGTTLEAIRADLAGDPSLVRYSAP